MQDQIQINVIDRDGKSHEIDIPLDMDLNLMEVFKAAELPVQGTCGGMALCSTCHCYVQTEHDTGEPSEDEEDMLDQAFFVKMNSRLGCQIKVRKELDGLIVKLAPEAVL